MSGGKTHNRLWLPLEIRVSVGRWEDSGAQKKERDPPRDPHSAETSQMERDAANRACDMEEGSERRRDVDVSEDFRD